MGARPMSAAAMAAGTSSIGMRPWNVTRSPIPSRAAWSRSGTSSKSRPYRSRRTSSRRIRFDDAGDRVEDDVELVDRAQRAGVDEPQLAVGHERARRVGAGLEAGQRRGVRARSRALAGGTPIPSSRSPSASFTVTTALANRQASALLHAEQPPPDRPGATTEAAAEELRHRLVQVEDDRDAGEPQRAASQRRGSPAGCGPGPSRSGGGRGRGSARHRRGRRTTGIRAGRPRARRPGGAGHRAGGRRRPRSISRAGSSGRRRANTSTWWPASASVSASRRTRGSSS